MQESYSERLATYTAPESCGYAGNGIDEVLMMTANSKDYYYLHDALGSVMALTDEDGTIVERYAYDAYGRHYILRPYNVLQDDAVALWEMNDNADSNTVADSGGNSCTGTSYRNTSLMTTTGKIDTALNFNGTSDRISIDSTNLPSSGPFTVSLWVYATTSSGHDRDAVWMQYYKSSSCYFTIGTDDRGSGRFKVRDAAGYYNTPQKLDR